MGHVRWDDPCARSKLACVGRAKLELLLQAYRDLIRVQRRGPQSACI